MVARVWDVREWRGRTEMNRQSTEDAVGSENALYVMMTSACRYILIQTRRVNSNVNYGI